MRPFSAVTYSCRVLPSCEGLPTSDLMMARTFLTRWLSSSFSMRWRTSARSLSPAISSL
ncbi:hypothetical protein D3C72_1253780 [compost metagenome]